MYDSGTDAVNGLEGQPVRHIRSEQGGKAGCHVLGRRHRISHRQNFLRSNALCINHVAEAGHQHCGFAGAGHSKKQYRAFHTLYCFLLLFI